MLVAVIVGGVVLYWAYKVTFEQAISTTEPAAYDAPLPSIEVFHPTKYNPEQVGLDDVTIADVPVTLAGAALAVPVQFAVTLYVRVCGVPVTSTFTVYEPEAGQ